MKKLVRKLALSCAALAVCAATLVSSTFAWYTTNAEVEATGLTSGTAESGTASIFISKTGADGSWATAVEINDFEATELIPLQYVNDTTNGYQFQKLDAVAGNTINVISFDLYFKTLSGADTTLNIKEYALKNVATEVAGLPAYDNLNAGTGENANKYTVDVVEALGMVITSDSDAASDAVLNKVYTLEDGTTSLGVAGIVDDAHTYYESIMGEAPATPGNGTPDKGTVELEAATTIATLPASGEKVKFTFYIFLNGWDTECYDACKAQDFTFSISFNAPLA